ncbi:glycoside hydrolase family 3 protein [Mrakia frigida]|uniref:beta-glucosidase n=1 Tax=Mrakia frigida TaxID=29902 RepID=UPI003FCC04B4
MVLLLHFLGLLALQQGSRAAPTVNSTESAVFLNSSSTASTTPSSFSSYVVSSTTSLASSLTVEPISAISTPTSTIEPSISSTSTSSVAPAPEQTNLVTSPFVGPTPETRGEGAWADAVRKAKALISTWTIEQKANVTTGVGWTNGRCVGNIASQPEIGFPNGLCLQDSPLGIRFADFASSFPAGINAASTFDRELIRARGLAMGQEFRGKGINIALGPMTNMGRVSEGGRNWEGFGGDPYLSGEATYETIIGMQTPKLGTQACVKHYIANEQERNRTTSSSNINDRTMHEIYLHPFLRSVQAEVASFMCSYNLINNTYACENPLLQNQILKQELGFQGAILSDWAAQMSGVPSILGGLDMSMPGDITFNSGTTYMGKNLTDSVMNGTVPESRLDDMATRILAGWYLLEQDQDDFPLVNFDSWDFDNPETNLRVDVQDDHHKIIRHMGAASTVLLKNVNGVLPLKAGIRSIAVIGEDAGPSRKGPNGYPDHGGLDGALASGWGSGTADFPYLISPLEAIQAKARENRTTVGWHLDNFDIAGANSTALRRDAVLVFVASDSGEGYITVDGNEGDRKNLTAWKNGDTLVQSVAAKNKNVIVIVHSVGPITLEPWIDHPNVTAVLWAGLPGSESGNSLVDVLWGDYNPSGRLPYTISKDISDYSAQIRFDGADAPPHPQVDYTEELNIDYRHFLSNDIEPRFGFGYGLSYTNFSYTNLNIIELSLSKRDNEELELYHSDGEGSLKGAVGSSLFKSLHAERYSVEFDLTNTGDVNGCDIPQLYLRFPEDAGEPPAVLRGFERINLDPGATAHVTMPLSLYSLSIWDVVHQKWTRPAGDFGVIIGQSAFDVQLEGTIYA